MGNQATSLSFVPAIRTVDDADRSARLMALGRSASYVPSCRDFSGEARERRADA